MARVRTGAVYTFHPASYDRLMPEHYDAREGQRVRVVRLPGAPPPNTMGHAHIADAATGAFLGLVCTASLVKGGR
jgi:hypothetical protein